MEDIKQINAELAAYNSSITNKPQVIAANKTDCLTPEDLEEVIAKIKETFPETEVFPISAATGDGVKPLLYKVKQMLDELPEADMRFEPEVDTRELFDRPDEPIYTGKEGDGHTFTVTGPRVDKMLGYTNLESEKGFLFFQEFMEKNGVIKELKKLGLAEGDTVRVGDYLEFEYFEGQDFE